MLPAHSLYISLVIVRRHQLILAARKKCLKILQELRGLGQPSEKDQPELGDVATEQDAVVYFVQWLDLGIGRPQDFFKAERMERAEPHALGAVARGFHHPALHLARGFGGERQPENILSRKRGIGLQQIADALSDHARLTGACAGYDQQRTLAVPDGCALLAIER